MWQKHSQTQPTLLLLLDSCAQWWRSHWGGKGRQSANPDSEKLAKNREKKRGKIRKNRGKKEKSGKKRKNREEKAKIAKFLSLCPSWQIGLATLLVVHPIRGIAPQTLKWARFVRYLKFINTFFFLEKQYKHHGANCLRKSKIGQ